MPCCSTPASSASRGRSAGACARLGLEPDAVKAILMTHGHLDHAGNLAWAKAWSGAPIYAHPLEQQHIDGTYPYVGRKRLVRAVWSAPAARCCGSAGRPRSTCRSRTGTSCRSGAGLRVVHLPGHTLGHCGFYSRAHDLLFSGDLFASYFFNVHLPPRILNSAPELIPQSLEKARRLDPRLMVPQHYDILDGALHRRRFDRLLAKADARIAATCRSAGPRRRAPARARGRAGVRARSRTARRRRRSARR